MPGQSFRGASDGGGRALVTYTVHIQRRWVIVGANAYKIRPNSLRVKLDLMVAGFDDELAQSALTESWLLIRNGT